MSFTERLTELASMFFDGSAIINSFNIMVTDPVILSVCTWLTVTGAVIMFFRLIKVFIERG